MGDLKIIDRLFDNLSRQSDLLSASLLFAFLFKKNIFIFYFYFLDLWDGKICISDGPSTYRVDVALSRRTRWTRFTTTYLG